MRIRKRSVLRVFLITNIIIGFVAIVDYLLGANYFYLCEPPNANNVLIQGEWPFYFISFEVMSLFIFLLLDVPMILSRKKKHGYE